MTVELKDLRTVAVITWDLDVVKGTQATLEVSGQEKRVVANDGESNLFFPFSYTGTATVTVRGSHSGEETGEILVDTASE